MKIGWLTLPLMAFVLSTASSRAQQLHPEQWPNAPLPDAAAAGARPGNDVGTGMSLPRSDHASNIDAATTRSELAPNLPPTSAGDEIQPLLMEARAALIAGRSGEAQEALEQAETRSLDRSVPYGGQNVPDQGVFVAAVRQARSALAAGDIAGAVAAINRALPHAASADGPR